MIVPWIKHGDGMMIFLAEAFHPVRSCAHRPLAGIFEDVTGQAFASAEKRGHGRCTNGRCNKHDHDATYSADLNRSWRMDESLSTTQTEARSDGKRDQPQARPSYRALCLNERLSPSKLPLRWAPTLQHRHCNNGEGSFK
jgi:hypothetical protein